MATELDIAAHYRIRHSEFLSWAKPDRDKAIVQWHRSKTLCRSCGTRREEWEPDEGGDQHAYDAVLTHCRGCQVVDTKKTELKHQVLPGGTYISLRHKPTR